LAKLYPSRNTVTSFGVKSSTKVGEASGEGRVCVDMSLVLKSAMPRRIGGKGIPAYHEPRDATHEIVETSDSDSGGALR